MSNSNKIIVILGPTSSGKSDVAIKLARKFNGEILSVDSRQIYRGMDVGTGKITKSEQKIVKHYGIDIANPKTNYNAAQFKKYADKIMADILKRGKIPIICGGTGFWIKAIVDNVVYPEVAPDWELRNKLNTYSAEKLFKMLQKLDPVRAKTIDRKNPVRLIRAIEICRKLGKVPVIRKTNGGSTSIISIMEVEPPRYQLLQIGISLPKEKLYQNIKKRLKKRFKAGMIEEVKKLHYKDKISWKKLQSFGLGYKLIPEYLQGKIITKEALFEQNFKAEKNYAKRQMTWFKKDKKIVWLDKYPGIEKKAKEFLNS